MKKSSFIIRYLLGLVLLLAAGNAYAKAGDIKDGDIIFQTSLGGQGMAIKIATKSQYTHCGIIYNEGGQAYVYEAVQPVKRTPLKDFIARGDNGHYVIKRLKNADKVLSPAVINKMKQTANQFTGKNYDLAFGWSDDRMYCSELVWKIYKRSANVEVGKLQQLKEFDLSHPIVQAKLRERYGNKVPLEEQVISPGAIFQSDALLTVEKN